MPPWLGLDLFRAVSESEAFILFVQYCTFLGGEDNKNRYLFEASRIKTVCSVVCTRVISEDKKAVRCFVSWKKAPMMQKLE